MTMDADEKNEGMSDQKQKDEMTATGFVVNAGRGVFFGPCDTLKPVMGFQICWATHPMQKNLSGNARGRCLHYRMCNQRLTLCNMLFAQRADKMTKENGACSGKVCKVCVQKITAIERKRGEMGNDK